MEYYLYKDNCQTGPYTIGQLRSMWASGTLTADTLFWHEGACDWIPLRTLTDKLEQAHQAKSPVTSLSKKEMPPPIRPGFKAPHCPIQPQIVREENTKRQVFNTKLFITIFAAIICSFIVIKWTEHVANAQKELSKAQLLTQESLKRTLSIQWRIASMALMFQSNSYENEITQLKNGIPKAESIVREWQETAKKWKGKSKDIDDDIAKCIGEFQERIEVAKKRLDSLEKK